MAMVVEHGYTDPRWATARQYSEKGYFIKKGEHGVLCEKWIFEKQKKVKDHDGNVSFETVQLERPQVSFCMATSHRVPTVLARGDTHVATAIIESPEDLR